MARPYESTAEYLAQLMQRAELRLTPVERKQEGEQLGEREMFQQARQFERQMEQRIEATFQNGGAVNLPYLFRVFDLTEFEQHSVVLSLAAELDRTFEQRFAAVQSDHCRLPSLDLCLRSYVSDSGTQALLLQQWHARENILNFFFTSGYNGGAGQSDLAPGLKLDRRISAFVLDPLSKDPALEFSAALHWANEPICDLVIHRKMLDEMCSGAELTGDKNPLLFFFKGEKGSGRQTLARHFCLKQQKPLLTADIRILLQAENSWEEALLPVFREAALRQAALAFTGFELLLDEGPQTVKTEEGREVSAESQDSGHQSTRIRFLLERAAQVTQTLFLFSEHEWNPEISCRPWIRAEFNLDLPDTSERLQLWKYYLKDFSLENIISLDSLAAKFAMQPGQIASAAAEAKRLTLWNKKDTLQDDILHQACRAQLSHSLGKKATLVKAKYTWDDLILPYEQKRRLKEACAQVEHRRRVYDEWGFGGKVAYGRGVSMLFNGPPGTGKTMAAQVIANRLHLELYKVDLSGVLSKYVGETEKQLGVVFDEVKKSQSILFFDEADALFGKRSETKDSNDRYANIQTSYLLQKMEEYDGIVILASNFLQNFDEAFRRRIKFIIDFTLPDQERREQIWRSVMPADLPRSDDIDFDFLARSFELSGSSIKNITVSAAFLAAAEDSPLKMVHLLLAARDEQQKAGKNLGKEEFGEYYHQVLSYSQSKMEQE